jgi:hypothetical protein
VDHEEQPLETAEPSGRSKALVISVSLALVALAIWGAWAAISPGPQRHAADESTGYYVRFPDQVAVPTDDPNGGATFAADTNLPAGTMALIQYSELPGDHGGGSSCCPEISSGHLDVTVFNNTCYLPPGATGSTGFTVTITVRPVFDNVAFEGPVRMASPGQSPKGPPSQPDSVLSVLGAHFENLTGDQVAVDGDVNQLVATRAYDWPVGTCAPEKAAMVPATCPTKGELISEDGSADAVAKQVIGALQQVRLCELWGEASLDFQAAHPWSEFASTWQHWLDGLGSLAGPSGDPFEGGPLRSEVVQVSKETFEAPSNGTVLPERIVADYFYNDRKIGEVEFVHGGPSDPGVVPQYSFDRFDLY